MSSVTERLQSLEISNLDPQVKVMSSTTSTERLQCLEVSNSDPRAEHWQDAPHLGRKVNKMLIRPPRVRGHLQLFGFMISEDDLLKLAHIGFKSIWPSRTPHPPGTMLCNAASYVQDSLAIPQCFTACAKIPPGVKVPPEYLFTPDRIRIIALWADSQPDEDCPWPGHISRLRRKIGRAPRWWVDSDPEHFWRAGQLD
ncbi:hypothetical protein V8B97DRAFT_2107719 [Scleroderma yunnanense]